MLHSTALLHFNEMPQSIIIPHVNEMPHSILIPHLIVMLDYFRMSHFYGMANYERLDGGRRGSRREAQAVDGRRAVDVIHDDVAAECAGALVYRGREAFVCTAVDRGRVVQMYHARSLRLVGCAEMPDQEHVQAFSGMGDWTFVATENHLVVLLRMRVVWRMPLRHGSVASMLCFGQALVLLYAHSRVMECYNVAKDQMRRLCTAQRNDNADTADSIELELLSSISWTPADEFRPLTLLHPDTYVNKVLVVGEHGRMELRHVLSGACTYEYQVVLPDSILHTLVHTHKDPLCLVTVAGAPVLDMIALGTSSGLVLIYDLKGDRLVEVFRHEPSRGHRLPAGPAPSSLSAEAVTAISFRDDGDESLVSTTRGGELAVWDLNERALRHVVPCVHSGHGGVAFARFLRGEHHLLTCGRSDNAMKLVAFDQPDGNGRVVLFRAGHSAAPHLIRYCGDDHRQLLSAGRDNEIRIVSVIQDSQNRPFSHAQTGMAGGGKKLQQKRRKVEGALHGDGLWRSSASAPAAGNASQHGGATGVSSNGLLGHVLDLAASGVKSGDSDFANVVTCHQGNTCAFTWRSEDNASTRKVLRLPVDYNAPKLKTDGGSKKMSDTGKKTHAHHAAVSISEREQALITAVAVTADGHVAFIGTSSGRIFAFSMQSGRLLGEFNCASSLPSLQPPPPPLSPSSSSLPPAAHSPPHQRNQVCGIAVDALGESVASLCEKDTCVVLWNVRSRRAEYTLALAGQNVHGTRMVRCLQNDLIAVVCDDFSVQVFDVSSRSLARIFRGHAAKVTDVAFSHDARMLLTTSMDGTIRTWSLLEGKCFDLVHCSQPPVSIACSPVGDFIATSHVDSLGIVLWVNKRFFNPRIAGSCMYDHGHSDSLSHLARDPAKLPQSLTHDEEQALGKVDPLARGLVTLSNVPVTQWSTLANLHLIKERNKPLEAVKKDATAPFFLPTVAGTHPTFELPENAEQLEPTNAKEGMRKSKLGLDLPSRNSAFYMSEIAALFLKEQFDAAGDILRAKTPSDVDVELRLLEGPEVLRACVNFFTDRLGRKIDFQLVQAHLSHFLVIHSHALLQDAEMQKRYLPALRQAQENAWNGVQRKLEASLTYANHMLGTL
ncbi:WD repeat-containing protein 36 [Porphyridium purpureum]|uniref:WD repeat-containing protein 36 n=1 Tax=Porphyridium purpureum TaxID=35688 RepID=A0A5J4YPV2_PORPP|nr:WD repeat-containing protein 36 [Porphyridium purpureum]|eukprot:POR9549..scf295_9